MTQTCGSLALITAPTDDVLSFEEVKTHLKEDEDDNDDLIELFINAAVGEFDAASGGWLGRALRPQTWELRLSAFPSCPIEIPYVPLTEVVSVKYDDANGTERTLALGTGYRILGLTDGDELPNRKCSIAPPYNTSWPIARADHETVRIRFTCGYPVADAEADPPVIDRLPYLIRAKMLLMIGTLFAQRESIVIGVNAIEVPDHIRNMISHLRIY